MNIATVFGTLSSSLCLSGRCHDVFRRVFRGVAVMSVGCFRHVVVTFVVAFAELFRYVVGNSCQYVLLVVGTCVGHLVVTFAGVLWGRCRDVRGNNVSERSR